MMGMLIANKQPADKKKGNSMGVTIPKVSNHKHKLRVAAVKKPQLNNTISKRVKRTLFLV